MNPITHALAGWCLAESCPSLGPRERGLIVLASVASDVDGFGALPELLTRNSSNPLFWWTDYHHVLAHNFAFAALAGAIAAIVAARRPLTVGILAFVAVHIHLLGDIAGSRGPDGYNWPIPYLYPFASEPALSWWGQWALNGWQNIAITVVMLAAVFSLAWNRGHSPLGLMSRGADAAFVAALRSRFPRSS
jgi:membrane-bound metal-dependent hydrolase YbcI (DUF457 family)